MVRVLIVDDSAVARTILSNGLSSVSGIEVVGTAGDAYEARDKIVELKPDVMTLDIQMPRLNGIDFLKKLMPQYPIPVIVVSSLAQSNADLTLQALEAGAVDYVLKPSARYNLKPGDMIEELGVKVKMAANVDVSGWKKEKVPVRRRKRTSMVNNPVNARIVIAVGASTGGTKALRSIITNLPPWIPGIVVVQHMPPVFTRMFADSLNTKSEVTVKEAEEGDRIIPGQVLIAPGDFHLEVTGKEGDCRVTLKTSAKVNGHRPAVDVLFNSVAKNCCPRAVGIVLTGMGRDGASGLYRMRYRGARTLAQDKESSVVFGMPREAYENGGAEKLVSLDDIVTNLIIMLEEMT